MSAEIARDLREMTKRAERALKHHGDAAAFDLLLREVSQLRGRIHKEAKRNPQSAAGHGWRRYERVSVGEVGPIWACSACGMFTTRDPLTADAALPDDEEDVEP
jgi:hypothetical protein